MAGERLAGLTLIFRASFHQAEVSNGRHDVFVSPLYKLEKTDKSNSEKYRSISLTSMSLISY